ncbi:nucleotidyltransferase family protein [Streptomyces sp. NPDC052042]|uniref:nucleotidyltransferase family protein n=1 Tax=Streptomyces sp. NPDC052042 TaxID=3365683 RepID=UPI0037D492FD
MNAPAMPSGPAAPSGLPGGARPGAAVLRWLCDPRLAAASAEPDSGALGAVLQTAIDAKLICLLADRLLHDRAAAVLSRAMQSVLGQIMRANALYNRLHHTEAVRIVHTLAGRGVPVAVLNGLVYDTGLYPPGGLRQFTDIDLLVGAADLDMALVLLVELGFIEQGRRPATGDALTPTVSVDITTIVGHTTDPADLLAVLARTLTADGPAARE